MGWEIEYTDEFESWWNGVSEDEQDAITAAVEVLGQRERALGRPLADTIHQYDTRT